MKHLLGIFALIALFILAPSRWNTASAQTPISFSFTGSGGANPGGGVLLTGSGTLNPYGPTTISVVVKNSGTNFTVTFANGSTWTATSSAASSGNTISGTATIVSGTGTFAGATGSFTFDVEYAVQSGDTITFSVTGSGTVNGSATLTYTYYFSQLAFAGGYQTTLTYINYGTSVIRARRHSMAITGARSRCRSPTRLAPRERIRLPPEALHRRSDQRESHGNGRGRMGSSDMHGSGRGQPAVSLL